MLRIFLTRQCFCFQHKSTSKFQTLKHMELAAESKIKLKDVGLTLKRTIFYFLVAFKINYSTSTLLGLISNLLRWYMKKEFNYRLQEIHF